MSPTITAICPSYNRPHLLGQAVAMFNAQDYPAKRLLIFEDSGVFGDNRTIVFGDWTLVSTSTRYRTVGAKRNAMVKLLSSDFVAVWDDDDTYLPWHLSAAVAALEKRPWAQPRQALEWDDIPTLRLGRYHVFGEAIRPRLNGGDPINADDAHDCCYGGQWSFRREEFLAQGGYPEGRGNGDDTIWCRDFFRRYGPSADTLTKRHPDPSYIYSREMSGSWHASEMGPGATPLRRLDEMPRADPGDFKIELPPYYDQLEIPSDVKPRKW